MSAEAHLRMMRRWEEKGIPPGDFPSEPTRIVKKDGTVIILKDDDKAPKSLADLEPAKVPDPAVIDLGEALLDPAAIDDGP